MKQISTRLLHLLVPTTVLFVGACTKEPLIESLPQGREVRFNISQTDGWNTPQSRAAVEGGDTPTSQVIKLRGESPADTLFLHVSSAPFGMDGEASSQVVTRGVPVDESTIENFGVYGYTYTGEWDTTSDRSLYVREAAEKSKNWTLLTPWPGSKFNIRFFAYTPELHNFVFDENSQTIRCHIAPEAENQRDLLVARTEGMAGNTNAPVSIGFSHAMTAVKFVVGEDMKSGYILKISISGVCGSGVYDFATNNWISQEGLQTYTFMPEDPFVEVGDSVNAPITPPEATFMLLPQALPEDAAIEVIYADALTGVSQTLTASIAGTQWQKGQTVTYRISTSSIIVEPHLQVESMEDFTYEGGTQNYSVSSYIEVRGANGVVTRVAAPWTAEFSTDDGQTWTAQKPEWLTSFTSEGAGSYAPIHYAATVAAQQGVTSNPHNDMLQAATPVVGTYDLSTKGGTTTMNTANCYIINAPGRYSLPLVYGNAIKNGEDNTNAYTYMSDIPRQFYALGTFINHMGNAITDPYIYNNTDCVPADATLVWQDAKDLVTNISLSQDGKGLFFEVSTSTIKQGNAVVAVRDAEGRIMWSWHIWVTDYVPGLPATTVTDDGRDKVVTDKNNVQHTMMPINIGWCYEEDFADCPERSVKVRFVQTNLGNRFLTSEKLTITQSGHDASQRAGNNPYFQWGRKDPILPGYMLPDDGSVQNKKWYNANGEESTTLSVAALGADSTCFANWILNPDKMSTDRSSEYNLFVNLWSANVDTWGGRQECDIVKTIYDPSPVGYCLPEIYGYSFCGFNNGYAMDIAKANISGPFDRGVYFYCEGDSRTGPLIFFPASGYRSYESPNLPTSFTIQGVCWSCRQYFLPFAIAFSFNNDYVTSNSSNLRNRSEAYSVRSIREQ